MVWAEDVPFPFEVYDNNGVLRARIDETGFIVYGPGDSLIRIRSETATQAFVEFISTNNSQATIAYDAINVSGEDSTQLYMQSSNTTDNAVSRIYAYPNSASLTMHAMDTFAVVSEIMADMNGVWTTGILRVLNSSWTDLTLQNAWVAAGGRDVPGYRMMPDGTIRFRGGMINGVTADGTQIAAALPVGFRPTNTVSLPVTSNSTATVPRITISPAGVITCIGLNANAVINMDNASFRSADLT